MLAKSPWRSWLAASMPSAAAGLVNERRCDAVVQQSQCPMLLQAVHWVDAASPLQHSDSPLPSQDTTRAPCMHAQGDYAYFRCIVRDHATAHARTPSFEACCGSVHSMYLTQRPRGPGNGLEAASNLEKSSPRTSSRRPPSLAACMQCPGTPVSQHHQSSDTSCKHAVVSVRLKAVH